MKIPFTVEQFLGVFERYNVSVYPVQWIAYLLGGAAVLLVMGGYERSRRLVPAILAVMWLWNGAFYHMTFFSAINKAAWLFGLLFIIQGGLLVWKGVYEASFDFAPGYSARSLIGLVFVLYAMGAYPLVNDLTGHGWPYQPMFGIAPCPTTIFTLGVFMMNRSRMPLYLLFVPVLWSVVGTSAALRLNIVADFGLIAAAVTCSIFIAAARRTRESVSNS